MPAVALSPLSSVTWTPFADPTLTSAQISTLQTTVNSDNQQASLINLAANFVPNGFKSPLVTDPQYIFPSLAGAQSALSGSTPQAALYYDAQGNIGIYARSGGSTSILTNAQKLANGSYSLMPGYSLYPPMAAPYYGAYASLAQASAAIQNAPAASAYSYVNSSGQINWVLKMANGTINSAPGITNTVAGLQQSGFTNIKTRSADPSLPTVTLGDLANYLPQGTNPGVWPNIIYAQYGSLADVTAFLSQPTVANNSAVTYYNAATGTVDWATKDWQTGAIHTNGPVANNGTTWAKQFFGVIGDPTQNPLSVSAINSALGTNYTAQSTFTGDQLAQLVSALQAASTSAVSKIPVENGGGCQFFNGQWYLNGQVTNFYQVFMRVRVNQLVNIDSQTATYINIIQQRNNQINEANYFLNLLNAQTPTDSSKSTPYTKIAVSGTGNLLGDFWAKYGFNPLTTFMPTSWAAVGNKDSNGTYLTSGSFTQAQMQAWATEVKSFVNNLQTLNQSDQTQLQTLSDSRTEITDSISTVIKATGQTGTDVGKNI